MPNLDQIAQDLRALLETKNAIRDLTLNRSRELTRLCALAIRAMHREEYEQAAELLTTARAAADTMKSDLAAHPDLYYTGYTQDALKELVEAHITLAIIGNRPIPSPQELGVEVASYLNGLCEAASELRRRCLDIIRHGHSNEAERLLEAMDDIYGVLVTMDFPEAITGGLRRNTDALRAVLERTRGDLTNSLRQAQLQAALQTVEKRLNIESNAS